MTCALSPFLLGGGAGVIKLKINIMDLNTPFLTVTQLGLVPLVMAVVSILKNVSVAGATNRFAPLYSLILGVGGAFLVPSATVQLTLIAGITIGCAAAGVYSGVKTTVQG